MYSERPSQVRARLLREHSSLRAQVDHLADRLDELEAGLPEARTCVVELAQSLYLDLRDHLDFEDELLLPALREIDSWGPVRAAELSTHHAAQRIRLRELAEHSACAAPARLVCIIREMVLDLRNDMAHEDHELLSVDLLRDDIVQADMETG